MCPVVHRYEIVKVFVLCAAPAPGTVDDFWQMIWDQNMVMVIMLTKTMEGTKVCICAHTYTYSTQMCTHALHQHASVHTLPTHICSTRLVTSGNLPNLYSARVKITIPSLLVKPSAVAGFR